VVAEEGPESVSVEELTEDQKAALALYGQPIIGWSAIALYYDHPPADGLGPDYPHVRRYRCPVILWRNLRRSIRPNGDIHEVTSSNDDV
jgi:hypothetical protein